MQTSAMPCQTVTSLCWMLTSQHAVAYFLTKILLVKSFENCTSPKIAKKAMFDTVKI